MAFLIVQHLDPKQKSHMAELLAKQTAMPVAEAEDGVPVEPDCVYTIPPGAYLTLHEGLLRLQKPAPGRTVRMPIDLLFRSLAEGLGQAAVGVVLSGTGSDGALGVRAVRGAGGLILVQDPESAEFDAMPQSAIATGLVNHVLPPGEMAQVLLSYVGRGHASDEGLALAGEDDAEEAVTAVLALLVRRAKSDFRGYKRGTLLRRIARRMSIGQVATLADYLRLLQEDPEEVTRLSQDMLIGVTSFFRDKEAFEELREKAIGPLVRAKEEGTPLRVWVPGCATGEEAYSVAMLLFAELEAAQRHALIHVFASDIDEEALAAARAGVYPSSIAEEVPADLLERFFAKVEGGYRVSKQLREAVVFTTQNLLTAPPFSNLDLISCRNVLIYFGAEAQDRVLSLFAFALHEGGYLFLGKSDSVMRQMGFFNAITKKGRLYQRSAIPHRALGRFEAGFGTTPAMGAREQMPRSQQPTLLSLPPQILLDHFGASLVLIDARGSILSFYGQSDKYLGHPTGMADLDLFSMARKRLSGRLRIGVRQAIERNAAVRLARVPVLTDGGSEAVDVTITPYLPTGSTDPLLAVIFQEAPEVAAAVAPPAAGEAGPEGAALAEQLEAELRASRAELLAATVEFEASNDQMLATHEEAVSLNEELQSTNEELEASQEELQSLNEELTTLNTQLNESMGELSATNNDILNLLDATEIATIFLDKGLRIRRFTPAAEGLLNLIASDLGRPIHHLSQNFTGTELAADTEAVLRTSVAVEREVVGREGAWYTMRVFPYRTSDGRVDGVVVTLADVSRLKHVEESLRSARAYAENIIATVREPLVVLDADLRVVSASAAFYRAFQIGSGETEGKLIYELGDGQWGLPALRQLLGEVLPSRTQFEDFEVQCEAPGAGCRTMLLNARCIEQEGARPPMILLAIEDITERKRAEEALYGLQAELETRVQERTAELAQANQSLQAEMAERVRAEEKQVTMVLEERTRIAREIHDTLAQGFTGVVIQLEVAEDALADDPEAARAHLLRARGLAREGLAEARRSVWDLRPQALERGDLVSALASLVGELVHESSVEIEFSHHGVPPRLPPDTESNLMRLCQEALANARRHARASSIRVALVFGPQQVELRVEDDGQGFDPSQQPHPHGFGFLSMTERAKRMGGQLIIDSQPGQGTRVVVLVPVVGPEPGCHESGEPARDTT
jgi:two-component system CheB/CheR fusion protein